MHGNCDERVGHIRLLATLHPLTLVLHSVYSLFVSLTLRQHAGDLFECENRLVFVALFPSSPTND